MISTRHAVVALLATAVSGAMLKKPLWNQLGHGRGRRGHRGNPQSIGFGAGTDGDLGDVEQLGDEEQRTRSLVATEGEFVTVWIDPDDTTFLAFDLKNLIRDDGSSINVLASATWAKGTFQEEYGQITTLHEPVGNTADTMIQFERSKDGTQFDVKMPLTSVRTHDSQAQAALKKGAWNGWIDSLDIYDGTMYNMSADAILVSGIQMLANGFYVSGWDLGAAIVSYRIISAKAYSHNLLVTATMQIASGSATIPVDITFSLLELPQKPMSHRISDDRLGYFTTDYLDVGQQMNETDDTTPLADRVDKMVSVINRFNISASDNNDIRFYVDPTVPKRWRNYFKEGVEAWNQAFKKIGREKAVRAILPEDAEWPKDYDPDDSRYSTISWSMSLDSAYALGLAKVDPRSGQILKADVIVTSGWVSAWLGDLEQDAPEVLGKPSLSRPESLKSLGSPSPKVKQQKSGNGFHLEEHTGRPPLAAHPSWARHDNVQVRNGQDEEFEATSITFDGVSRLLSPDDWEKEVGKAMRNVVMHEVGHALGLRHNFKASMGIDTDCLKSKKCTQTRGVSVSVMDYMPANLFGVETGADLFSPVIGEYDELAIMYGYGEQTEEELNEHLVKAESLPVCSDEELTYGSDPFCAVHDLGKDPLAYYRKRLEILAEVQKNLFDTTVRNGMSYTAYGDAAIHIVESAAYIGSTVMSYIGGTTARRLHRMGDGTHPEEGALMAVPRDMQNEALSLVLGIAKTNITAYLPPASKRSFLVGRVGTNAVEAIDLNNVVRSVQKYLASQLTGIDVLTRIQSSSALSRRNTLTVADYVSNVTNVILGDLELAATHPRSWDMQTQLLKGFRDAYLTHCKESTSVPVSMYTELLLHLKSTRDTASKLFEQHTGGLIARARAAAGQRDRRNDPAFTSYLAYLGQELGKLEAPC